MWRLFKSFGKRKFVLRLDFIFFTLVLCLRKEELKKLHLEKVRTVLTRNNRLCNESNELRAKLIGLLVSKLSRAPI